MADHAAILQRQTEKIEELGSLLESEPTPNLVQALSSVMRDRSATYRALGETEKAIEDGGAAASMLAQLVLFGGRTDLVDRMVEAGEEFRAMLVDAGLDDDALSHAIGEAQTLARSGSLERGLASLRRLGKDAQAAFEDDPSLPRLEVLDEAQRALWTTLLENGRNDEALAVAEELVGSLEELEPTPARQLRRARRNRGLTLLALDRTAEARAELEAVADEYARDLGPDAEPDVVVEAVPALRSRAELLLEAGQSEEGMATFRRALDLVEPHADRDEGCDDALQGLFGAAVGAARRNGMPDEAVKFAERRCERLRRELEASGTLEAMETMLDGLYDLGLHMHAARRFEALLVDANQLVAAWEHLAAKQGNPPQLQQRILQALDLRERTLTELGRHDEAVGDQTRVIEGFRQFLGMGAPPQLLEGLAMTLLRRADSLAALGRHADAMQDRTEAARARARFEQATKAR